MFDKKNNIGEGNNYYEYFNLKDGGQLTDKAILDLCNLMNLSVVEYKYDTWTAFQIDEKSFLTNLKRNS